MRLVGAAILLGALTGCAGDGTGYSGSNGSAADVGAEPDSSGADATVRDAAPLDLGDDTAQEPDFDRPPPECTNGTSACGVHCVDTLTDPNNCGGCGRTCVIPNAAPNCTEGVCGILACDDGFADRDGLLSTGCEQEVLCAEGGECETDCGSVGSVVCVEDEPTCSVPAESCNGVDDNCDGSCDEGALPGCRVGVHRSYGDGHLYTTDLAAAQAPPFNLEAANYFRIYATPVPGTRPVFLCIKGSNKRFLTSDTACENAGRQERQLGYWASEQMCGAQPLYRLYHAPTDNHFYTLNAGERDRARDSLGYRTEGIAAWIWRQP